MNHLSNSLMNNNWGPFADFRREMDKLFDDFWPTTNRLARDATAWNPACDVREKDEHFLISVEMPGVSKDDVKIEVREGVLTISGERWNEASEENGHGLRYSERRFGRFQRSFQLPAGVDLDKVEANYQDGILRLYVPKAESSKPRQIKIANGNAGGFFGRLLGSPKKEKEVESSSDGPKLEKAV